MSDGRWQQGRSNEQVDGEEHLRRIVVEAAWSYRHRPGVPTTLRRRLDGQPAAIQVISWRAQQRLCHKYRRLQTKGKSSPLAVTAVARELLGFIRAVIRPCWTT